ncbi:MAG: hypothetical protein IJ574_02250 [Bacilli bacterium]|nr:hypothetical protein [Bacilli bacterium]
MSMMKKMMATMLVAGATGMATYILTNKSTKKKADKLIGTMIDEANDMLKSNNMQ